MPLIFTFECCKLLLIYITDSLWRRQSQQSFNTLTPFNFLLYSLHVSAPTSYPQVSSTISYYYCLCLFVSNVIRAHYSRIRESEDSSLDSVTILYLKTRIKLCPLIRNLTSQVSRYK
jgi:hypothetical protein